ncbi:MAG: hypothetical protein A2428_09995 [Bdellovibrionales bacterium RIFOXYC1_FULL_54_43]|nr:MAG: hypothetical protein A2428_09995 [Bdellovibrionales bacterium RIFOXYC1_FULL_54_43]OFZ80516.1 MAG: hypothetical protein A2603_13090 [Bdellovibrionales bacterium RIFOXYD1_FULL_55_31]
MASEAPLVYEVNDRPRNARDWGLYVTQWVVTMFYAVVWGYAIVGTAMGFDGPALTRYMSAVVLTIGMSTLVQAWLGHRFAMVSGPNVIPSLAIVAALTAGGKEYAQHAFMAQAISGLIIAVFGITGLLSRIRAIWSPLILGSMVLMVGLAIAGQGLQLLTSDGFGWGFAGGIALAFGGTYLALSGKGIWATLPPLFIIGLGYLIFMLTGAFQWELVTQAPTFVSPQFFPYGLAMPPWDLIVIMLVVNLMAALNLFGNLKGYSAIVKHDLNDQQTRRSFTLFGFIETTIPGILGAPATVAYGENMGIVALTRVAARSFIIVASVIFTAFAFLGPLGGLMAAMPKPVAGAVLLGITSTVIGIGAQMVSTAPAFGRREQTYVGFAVFLSLGLYLLPEDSWQGVPRILTTVFSNPIISVILFVLLFEKIIFADRKTKRPRKSEDRAREVA